ncbi:MAG: hypothetical protein JW745_05925, partial [Sedimentisphaerales bacterium]|nr:hypothetical protein [Sedimentisphaerales bacterium]
NTAALTVSIDKSELDLIFNLISEHKIKCQRIDLAISALLTIIKDRKYANGPQLTIFLVNNRLVIVAHENSNIIMVRNMPLKGLSPADTDTIANEIRLTWRGSFGGQISAQDTINLIGETDIAELIQDLKGKLGCELKPENIYDSTSFEEIPDNPGLYTIAISAGCLFFNPELSPEINLLKIADKTASINYKKRDIYISVFLTILLIVTLLINVTIKNKKLHDQHNTLIAHIDSIFADNLPDLKEKALNYDAKRKLAITQEYFEAEKQFAADYARLAAPRPDIIAIMSDLAKKLTGSTRFSSLKMDNNKIMLTAYSEKMQELNSLAESVKADAKFKINSIEENELNITLEIEIVAGKND